VCIYHSPEQCRANKVGGALIFNYSCDVTLLFKVEIIFKNRYLSVGS
jgi:hypothetical protein